jgi:hypothetical protein
LRDLSGGTIKFEQTFAPWLFMVKALPVC